MKISRFICALLLPVLAAGLWAQRAPGPPGRRPGAAPVDRKAAPPQRSPLDRWLRMSPQQRERALRQLPPERQKRLRDQLARFSSLPEEERDNLSRRYERFSELPPEKQELVRRQLRRFGSVPDERRQALAAEFRRLREMDEAGRRSRIGSEEFRTLYSAEEREMLQDLSENLSPLPRDPE